MNKINKTPEQSLEQLRFLTEPQVRNIAQRYGTPVFVYHQPTIEVKCDEALSFFDPERLTVRYAMKANSNAAILKIIDRRGLHFDASSRYEVQRAIIAEINPKKILLTAQQARPNDINCNEVGRVLFNATSLKQLEEYGKSFSGEEVSVRINPGKGSGGTTKTTTGGPSGPFGIWYEDIPSVLEIIGKYTLKVVRLHTHIGSGADPEEWKNVAETSINLMDHFPTATILNLGGGLKVGRMSYEKSADIKDIGKRVGEIFDNYETRTGRRLNFEIEPGTFLMANAGSLIMRVIDCMDTTSQGGYKFVKVDAGQTDNSRPQLYGAQHPLVVISGDGKSLRETGAYAVQGHNCESGDSFTIDGNGDIVPRLLPKPEIGDFIVMEGCGAYCSSMCTKNYNSFPEAPEVLIANDGSTHYIRLPQTMEQLLQNEVVPEFLR